MKIYKCDAHLEHQSKIELNPGKFVPTLDVAKRTGAVLDALRQAGHIDVLDCAPASKEDLRTIHSEDYLDFLATAWDQWSRSFGTELDGVGFVWPHRNRPPRCPSAIEGKIAYYMFDGVSTITPAMWPATLGAAGASLHGARDLRLSGSTGLVLARPPGHHACRDMGGGTSYTNHTALAAQELTRDGARVAILDVDAHHGNGAQDIFWTRSDVLTISLHTDPSVDYPYFSGYADEIGAEAGEGFNLNLPLRPGTDWSGYGEALTAALERLRDYSPDYVVVALGVDTYAKDPAGRLALELDDFNRIGEAVASLGHPHMFVLEGGYCLEAIGPCVLNVVAPGG
ncbi:histone deacetylase family protein [Mesorhizobium sp. M2A.F.Ca.ET.037.01.1.1]|uniref:histone deacetylase family protein n=1 Tax=unclassified Mesorhizobium TaxID=325217 RepID=UPI000FCBAE7B|nr:MULTISPECIES: histone deacetylase family protein [unclassified Mesorhizobium]RUX22404.1 histone deacetylase family protein [Mesorhizobium sp. M2A.F.Ca.ET.037.01.1.1]RWA91534.1 MAG: histone deacetylase family protein [Mesorhizobium sp.]